MFFLGINESTKDIQYIQAPPQNRFDRNTKNKKTLQRRSLHLTIFPQSRRWRGRSPPDEWEEALRRAEVATPQSLQSIRIFRKHVVCPSPRRPYTQSSNPTALPIDQQFTPMYIETSRTNPNPNNFCRNR